MFFMFNSLDDRSDSTLHPKFHVVYNDVSRYGNNYDPEKILAEPDTVIQDNSNGLSVEQRISDIKSQLFEQAKNFYLPDKLSQDTKIGEKVWKHIKSEVCENESFKQASWYTQLTEH